MARPKIFVDFTDQATQGTRLYLDRLGSLIDIERQDLVLEEGMMVTLYEPDGQDYLQADAVVNWDETRECWAADYQKPIKSVPIEETGETSSIQFPPAFTQEEIEYYQYLMDPNARRPGVESESEEIVE